MEIHQRLQIFYERLAAAPPCSTAQEALALVCRLIEEVEDEFCPMPRHDPPPIARTGRMYKPQADSVRRLTGGVIQARTSGHVIFCRRDGSIAICRRGKVEVEFEKAGAIH